MKLKKKISRKSTIEKKKLQTDSTGLEKRMKLHEELSLAKSINFS